MLGVQILLIYQIYQILEQSPVLEVVLFSSHSHISEVLKELN